MRSLANAVFHAEESQHTLLIQTSGSSLLPPLSTHAIESLTCYFCIVVEANEGGGGEGGGGEGGGGEGQGRSHRRGDH